MRNIELKVRCPNLDDVRSRVQELGAEPEWSRRQIDTYFQVNHGRLKLREEEGDPGATLIAYQRADDVTSRYSDYRLLQVPDAGQARALLTESLGVLATVDKRRELFRFGQTRIHLDEVEGLGNFVELETVLQGQSIGDARNEHEQVLTALRLNEHEPVPVSYSDLVLSRN